MNSRHLNPRPDYEYHHPEHVTALEEIQDQIQAKAGELDELKKERLRRITRAKEDGMQQVRIAMHLGVSKQLLRSWTLEAKELRRIAGERELF